MTNIQIKKIELNSLELEAKFLLRNRYKIELELIEINSCPSYVINRIEDIKSEHKKLERQIDLLESQLEIEFVF